MDLQWRQKDATPSRLVRGTLWRGSRGKNAALCNPLAKPLDKMPILVVAYILIDLMGKGVDPSLPVWITAAPTDTIATKT
jgi:hypothetical protein